MNENKRPLVVELEESLLKGHGTFELALFSIGENPRNFFHLVRALRRGRASLSSYLGRWALEALFLAPVRSQVVRLIDEARADDRPIVLATTNSQDLGIAAEKRFGPFAEVITTVHETELIGASKTRMLVERFGEKGFDYIGGGRADIELIRYSFMSFLTNPGRRLIKQAKLMSNHLVVIHDERINLPALFRLMRPHQWAKNLLLIVPLLGAGEFSPQIGLNVILGLLSFSAIASALYIANDVLDIQHDRRHPEKRLRPLANADLSLAVAAILFSALMIVGISLATLINMPFAGALFLYGVGSATYSFWLKRIAIADVFVLAGLYGIRVLAGAALAGVSVSLWLLSFSFFVFLSLALVKRFVEISEHPPGKEETLSGRGYLSSDRELVVAAGAGTGASSALLLALYIDDRAADFSGVGADLLWLVVPLLLYWVLRIWFLAIRGRVASDPVVFALRDRVSLMVGVVFVALFTLVNL